MSNIMSYIKELLHADDHSTNSDAVGSQSMCDELSTFVHK